jgi:hypothetical protein
VEFFHEEWEQLIYNLVRHYKERAVRESATGRFFKRADIGEDYGCLYFFTPENYASAITARWQPWCRSKRVGGPPWLIPARRFCPPCFPFCDAGKAPLFCFGARRQRRCLVGTIDRVKTLIAKYP